MGGFLVISPFMEQPPHEKINRPQKPPLADTTSREFQLMSYSHSEYLAYLDLKSAYRTSAIANFYRSICGRVLFVFVIFVNLKFVPYFNLNLPCSIEC